MNKKAVIFDLDGTIYQGNSLTRNVLKTLKELKQMEIEIIFLTNNSSKTREEIKDKLDSLGVKTTLDRIYTSSYATAAFLKYNNLDNLFLIGTKSFKKELLKFGLNVVDEKKADNIVIGLDISFNYETISKAFKVALKGGKIIASNCDKNFPVENGMLKPACNAIVSALLACHEKLKVDYMIGKPNVYMLESICRDWKFTKEQIYVVGDSLDSDIAMANNFSSKSMLTNGKDLCNIIDIIKKDIE